MKKVMLFTALICMAWATDFSKLSTEQLMNMRGNVNLNERPAFQQEMQKRMQSMTPAQKQDYMNSGNGMGMGQGMNSGKNNGVGQGMGMGKCMNPGKAMGKGKGKGNSAKGMNKGKCMNPSNNVGMGQNRMMNMPNFSEFDLNNNGYITNEELQKAQSARMIKNAEQGKMMKNAGNAPSFSSIDTNNNGKITPDEFKKHQSLQMGK